MPTYEDLQAENKALRSLYWLAHGCDGLYGDDGEMQCGRCLIDFKRDPVERIVEQIRRRGMAKLAEAQAKLASNPNSGHGHVNPRRDGMLARCGGPGICNECSREVKL